MTATFKPFELMTDEDYAAVGLRVGLEVHRQLATERKLFCRCPAGRYSAAYDAEIVRHMRPTPSESGEYDRTALMEARTRKNIFYRIHHDTVCTYEFDDTPPFPINEDALDIAVEIALMLRVNLVDELHVARKQYLDGSIPAGFQRTTVLGVDGSFSLAGRTIGVREVALEEDACREVSDSGHDRVFLTDRLGTPLVEIVTDPELRTPGEAAAACEVLRRMCRSTGKVRTGYGTARQDVNVSVAGGTRIEIKGVPQIGRIPRLVHNEARRQCALLAIREELRRRGITEESLECSTHDVTRVVGRTRHEPLRSALAEGVRVRCVVLRGFAGVLNTPTQEHTTFATEFSDRVRVIACLHRLPNLIHSDSAAESLSAREWKTLVSRVKAGHNDALLLVWGGEADTVVACEEIVTRAKEATVGVPSDSRQAHGDGTNGFERLLPGPHRMYPDTDLPPIVLSRERVERIAAKLPEPVGEREARFVAWGLSMEIVAAMSTHPRAELFERVVSQFGVKPTLAAVVFSQRMKAFARWGLRPERLTEEAIVAAFRAYVGERLSGCDLTVALYMMLKCCKADRIDEADAACIIDGLVARRPRDHHLFMTDG